MSGLYIHIPFCRSKCAYCDFVSYPEHLQDRSRYIDAMLKEMRRYHQGTALTTVYVGGGTPTMLPPEEMRRLLEGVRAAFDCRRVEEWTVEANPESLSDEHCALMLSCGVDRLSLGIQSFDDHELSFLGRIHSSAEAEEAFMRARRAGFRNIGIDLMYGLPGQTADQWEANLRRAVALNPEHLSLYPLSVEPDTPLGRRSVQIDDGLQAEMYEWSIDFLDARGYEHYEISNWSRQGYVSRHNLAYWQRGEYIGIGVAAASHRDGFRWKNTSSPDRYFNALASDTDCREELGEIDGHKRRSEDIILRLRCRSGVALTPSLKMRHGKSIERLLADALIEKEGETIRLSRKGMLFANQVMKEFIEI